MKEENKLTPENEFLIFAIEYYRNAKGLTGKEVADLFTKHNIYKLIHDSYFIYHIESPNNMVTEIDRLVASGKVWGKDKINIDTLGGANE
ncbi:MAG: DUF3791 domain-containing protein [Candidatus Ancillula sp.]|jgi:hypothetical protein|nr:DUF3791 domain-containing protein [Candidatus Ancillula sp.]